MSTVQEKQKKGVMYVYKMDTGKIKHDPDSSANTKKLSSRGGWGLRRSKTIREVIPPPHGGGGEKHIVEDEKSLVVPKGRKSVSGGDARKSVSYIEVNAASVAAYLQAKVMVTDMPAFMQVHAFRCARRTYDGLETFSSKQLASTMKKEFDKVYGPAWHCIVGSSFGSFVTHATGCFLYFSMEKLYILVFRTKVQRALDS